MEKWIKREVIMVVGQVGRDYQVSLTLTKGIRNQQGIDKSYNRIFRRNLDGKSDLPTVEQVLECGFDSGFNLYAVESNKEPIFPGDKLILLKDNLWGDKGDIVTFIEHLRGGSGTRCVIENRKGKRWTAEQNIEYQREHGWKKVIVSSDKRLGLPDFSDRFYEKLLTGDLQVDNLKYVLLNSMVTDTGIVPLIRKPYNTAICKPYVEETWTTSQLLDAMKKFVRHIVGRGPEEKEISPEEFLRELYPNCFQDEV